MQILKFKRKYGSAVDPPYKFVISTGRDIKLTGEDSKSTGRDTKGWVHKR